MGTAHQKRQRPPVRRDDEVRGESKASADAPPRRLRVRSCEFALLILKEEN